MPQPKISMDDTPRRDRHPVTSVESARLRYCPSSNTPRNAPSKRLSMGHTKGL